MEGALILRDLSKELIAPPGFEPGSRDPESRRIDHYPTGLRSSIDVRRYKDFANPMAYDKAMVL